MIKKDTKIIAPMFENIPAELRKWNQWVAWKADPRPNGIFAKVPVCPMTGANASTNDPTTGKGVFVSQIGHILGGHFLHITNQRQITGRFNNHLKDALLVFCDEAIWAGSKSDEGVLKAMITEDSFQVEPKGKDPFEVKNHMWSAP